MGKLAILTAAGLALAAVGAATAIGQPLALRPPAAFPLTPPQLLTQPLPPGQEQVAHGRYLVKAGDCVACHTPVGAAPFSGGRAVNTPFGTIYSTNLTGDTKNGVGRYSPDQFWRALHTGINAEGHHLYPAFPYAYFTRVSRADSDAMLAYLKTVPAVDKPPTPNKLPFPLNIRFMVAGWNLLFFKPAAWTPQSNQSSQWNRGSYLVETVGHCGMCHTPKNMLGADKTKQFMQGGLLDNWYAPDLTGNRRFGLGAWSQGDIVEFLKTGRNAHANVTGAMAEVISDSTSLLSDADLNAMAVYLKSIPADGQPAVPAPDPRAMKAGAALYFDNCTGCHREGGVGVARWFPPLKGHAGVQQADATNTVRVILAGARTAPTPTAPTPLSMPSFAWKLSDEQIADVATYVRNSWGNQAKEVSPAQVKRLRAQLHPQEARTVH